MFFFLYFEDFCILIIKWDTFCNGGLFLLKGKWRHANHTIPEGCKIDEMKNALGIIFRIEMYYQA